MEDKARKCLFVVSHPRSGTHLLIDFIRYNFPAFNRRLAPLQSSSNLYVNIDHANWRQCANKLLQEGVSHVLIKSHLAGYKNHDELEARSVFAPKMENFLYPFRKFSKVIKSYAEFRKYRGHISELLDEQDMYFGSSLKVADCVRAHAESWLERDASFVDCDSLLSDPQTACERLALLLSEPAATLRQRLPGRKRFAGKMGELLTRVAGRQSTEVVVPYKLDWVSCNEANSIDKQFSDLYARLSKRRII
jgi:hypothetical protein